MRQHSIETLARQQQTSAPSKRPETPDSAFNRRSPTEMIPQSPLRTSLSRSSSIYSARSAKSDYSQASAGTTISQIVDMYTDLIEKIPYIGDSLSNTQILQPRAYRDTVAPLLVRRFSVESFAPTQLPSPIPFIPPLRLCKEKSDSALLSSYQQAPGFREFSRNLRDRRAELVSPMSAILQSCDGQPAADDKAELSPTTAQARPFSWTSDGMDVTLGIDIRAVSPLSDLTHTNNATVSLDNPLETSRSRNRSSSNVGSIHQQAPLGQPTQTLKPQHITNKSSSLLLGESGTVASPEYRASRSERYYRQASTASDSTDSFVIYTGVGGAVKALIKDKIRRRREARESNRVMATAAQKYPGMRKTQDEWVVATDGRRKSSLSEGLGSIMRRLSATSPIKDTFPTQTPRRRQKQAAIPLTPYQKHGIEVWYAENKKKRKDERQRQREVDRLKAVQGDMQSNPDESERSRHQRTGTGLSYMSDTHVGGKLPVQGRKSGFISALESARNSLIQSPAEKRREKLKESIVLLGPTQLTAANASPRNGR